MAKCPNFFLNLTRIKPHFLTSFFYIVSYLCEMKRRLPIISNLCKGTLDYVTALDELLRFCIAFTPMITAINSGDVNVLE
jgi:hypothetical protein